MVVLLPSSVASYIAFARGDRLAVDGAVARSGLKLSSFACSLEVSLSSWTPSPPSPQVTLAFAQTCEETMARTVISFETSLEEATRMRGELERVLRGMSFA